MNIFYISRITLADISGSGWGAAKLEVFIEYNGISLSEYFAPNSTDNPLIVEVVYNKKSGLIELRKSSTPQNRRRLGSTTTASVAFTIRLYILDVQPSKVGAIYWSVSTAFGDVVIGNYATSLEFSGATSGSSSSTKPQYLNIIQATNVVSYSSGSGPSSANTW